jgi:hypothetical protein
VPFVVGEISLPGIAEAPGSFQVSTSSGLSCAGKNLTTLAF